MALNAASSSAVSRSRAGSACRPACCRPGTAAGVRGGSGDRRAGISLAGRDLCCGLPFGCNANPCYLFFSRNTVEQMKRAGNGCTKSHVRAQQPQHRLTAIRNVSAELSAPQRRVLTLTGRTGWAVAVVERPSACAPRPLAGRQTRCPQSAPAAGPVIPAHPSQRQFPRRIDKNLLIKAVGVCQSRTSLGLPGVPGDRGESLLLPSALRIVREPIPPSPLHFNFSRIYSGREACGSDRNTVCADASSRCKWDDSTACRSLIRPILWFGFTLDIRIDQSTMVP